MSFFGKGNTKPKKRNQTKLADAGSIDRIFAGLATVNTAVGSEKTLVGGNIAGLGQIVMASNETIDGRYKFTLSQDDISLDSTRYGVARDMISAMTGTTDMAHAALMANSLNGGTVHYGIDNQENMRAIAAAAARSYRPQPALPAYTPVPSPQYVQQAAPAPQVDPFMYEKKGSDDDEWVSDEEVRGRSPPARAARSRTAHAVSRNAPKVRSLRFDLPQENGSTSGRVPGIPPTMHAGV